MYKIYKSIIQDGIPGPIQVRTGENKDESHGIPVVTKLISVASRADMVMEDDKEEERTETYRPHPSLKEEPCEWESVCTRKTEKADVGVAAEVEGEELVDDHGLELGRELAYFLRDDTLYRVGLEWDYASV